MIAIYLAAGFVGALFGIAVAIYLGLGWIIVILAYILGGAAGILLAAVYNFLKAWRGARRYTGTAKAHDPAATRQPAADSVASDKTASR